MCGKKFGQSQISEIIITSTDLNVYIKYDCVIYAYSSIRYRQNLNLNKFQFL